MEAPQIQEVDTSVRAPEKSSLEVVQSETEGLRRSYGLADQQKALTLTEAQERLGRTQQEAISAAKYYFGVTVRPPEGISPSEQIKYQLAEYDGFTHDELKLIKAFGLPVMTHESHNGRSIPPNSLAQLIATVNRTGFKTIVKVG